jgi:hypothetical protein
MIPQQVAANLHSGVSIPQTLLVMDEAGSPDVAWASRSYVVTHINLDELPRLMFHIPTDISSPFGELGFEI